MMDYPEYLDWTVKGREWADNWEYREFDGYPSADAPESEIMKFKDDAKEAEKAIQHDLMDEGMSKQEAWRASCQWPLVDDAPIEAIRSFIGYMYNMGNSAKNGVVL